MFPLFVSVRIQRLSEREMFKQEQVTELHNFKQGKKEMKNTRHDQVNMQFDWITPSGDQSIFNQDCAFNRWVGIDLMCTGKQKQASYVKPLEEFEATKRRTKSMGHR